MGLLCQPSLILLSLCKTANLTAMIDEKEQSLQEKTEVILQKEQEILQLKKGKGLPRAQPSHLFLPALMP